MCHGGSFGSFLRTWFQQGLGNITLKYWGYHLQQIFENDVKQIPKIGHLPPGKLTVCCWKWLFIVSFPIKWWIFPSFLYVYQRVPSPGTGLTLLFFSPAVPRVAKWHRSLPSREPTDRKLGLPEVVNFPTVFRASLFPVFLVFLAVENSGKKKNKMNWCDLKGTHWVIFWGLLVMTCYDLLWANWWNFTNSRS